MSDREQAIDVSDLQAEKEVVRAALWARWDDPTAVASEIAVAALADQLRLAKSALVERVTTLERYLLVMRERVATAQERIAALEAENAKLREVLTEIRTGGQQ